MTTPQAPYDTYCVCECSIGWSEHTHDMEISIELVSTANKCVAIVPNISESKVTEQFCTRLDKYSDSRIKFQQFFFYWTKLRTSVEQWWWWWCRIKNELPTWISTFHGFHSIIFRFFRHCVKSTQKVKSGFVAKEYLNKNWLKLWFFYKFLCRNSIHLDHKIETSPQSLVVECLIYSVFALHVARYTVLHQTWPHCIHHCTELFFRFFFSFRSFIPIC